MLSACCPAGPWATDLLFLCYVDDRLHAPPHQSCNLHREPLVAPPRCLARVLLAGASPSIAAPRPSLPAGAAPVSSCGTSQRRVAHSDCCAASPRETRADACDAALHAWLAARRSAVRHVARRSSRATCHAPRGSVFSGTSGATLGSRSRSAPSQGRAGFFRRGRAAPSSRSMRPSLVSACRRRCRRM
jgi:hypothetical protein